MSTAAIIIAAIFADNLLLSRLFGIESFFSSSEKRSSSLVYGGLVTLVTVIAGTVTVVLNRYVFTPLGIEYMSTFATAMVILAVICGLHLLSKRISEKLYVSFTVNMPMISTNCVVMGAARMCTEYSLPIGQSALFLLAAGVGFTLSLLIFSSVQERLENVSMRAVPSFRGLPILLLSAAFAAMAFAGFCGVGA